MAGSLQQPGLFPVCHPVRDQGLLDVLVPRRYPAQGLAPLGAGFRTTSAAVHLHSAQPQHRARMCWPHGAVAVRRREGTQV